MEAQPFLFSDLMLARRLERVEGRSNADFVEARARVSPEVGAAWIEVAGTLAMFDGIHSPCTQTFCLGMFAPVTGGDLDLIEAFYRERGAPVFHEVSPLADPSALALLNERGYHPIEFTSVMHRPIGSGVPLPASPNEAIEVRLAAALREKGIKTQQVRSARDESEPLIRLADRWAGCIRGRFEGNEAAETLVIRAIEISYLIEV